jgi:hypothetical protein
LRAGWDHSGDAVEEAAVNGTGLTRGPDAGTPRSRRCAAGGWFSVVGAGCGGLAPTSFVAHQPMVLESKGFLRRDPHYPRTYGMRASGGTHQPVRRHRWQTRRLLRSSG